MRLFRLKEPRIIKWKTFFSLVLISTTLLLSWYWFDRRKRDEQSRQEIAAILSTLTCPKYSDVQSETNSKSGQSLTEDGETFINADDIKQWKPRGCQLQPYWPGTPQILKCAAKNTSIVLIGDSRMRQLQEKLFWLINGIEDPDPAQCDPPAQPGNDQWQRGQCNSTGAASPTGLVVKRWWDTMLDSRFLISLLDQLSKEPSSTRPDVVVINSGAWLLKHCYENGIYLPDCVKTYIKIILEINPALKRLTATIPVIWMPQTKVDRRYATIFLSAEQNGAIPALNQIASCLLADTDVIFWQSFVQIYDWFGDTHDGLHQGPSTVYFNAQIILNFICNGKIGMNKNFCCA